MNAFPVFPDGNMKMFRLQWTTSLYADDIEVQHILPSSRPTGNSALPSVCLGGQCCPTCGSSSRFSSFASSFAFALTVVEAAEQGPGPGSAVGSHSVCYFRAYSWYSFCCFLHIHSSRSVHCRYTGNTAA